MTDVTFLIFLIPAIFLGAFGSLLLKKGANKLVFEIKSLIKNKEIFIGILLFGFSMILYLPALKYANLSVVYPLSSISYALIAVLSVKFLNEKMNLRKWIGIIFIIFGSFLLVI